MILGWASPKWIKVFENREIAWMLKMYLREYIIPSLGVNKKK